MLATLVQILGEDEAFELSRRSANVNQYTKSGSAPIKAAARGETTIGVTFMHDMVTEKVQGFPIEIARRARARLRDRLDEHHQGRRNLEAPRTGTTGR